MALFALRLVLPHQRHWQPPALPFLPQDRVVLLPQLATTIMVSLGEIQRLDVHQAPAMTTTPFYNPRQNF